MKSGSVSLIGRPNAGKSTLLNRLVGVKLAIVSDKPQTTRNRILGVRNYPPYTVRKGAGRSRAAQREPLDDARGGPFDVAEGAPEAQVMYLDTPGIHRPLHRMNVRMVDAAVETFPEVDILGLVVDATARLGKGDRYLIDLIKTAGVPVFLILNKIDLIKKVRLLPMIAEYSTLADFAEIVPVSASTGDNVDRLERAIVDRLPEGERRFPDDFLTDQSERFLASEIVREKLLQATHAEIPFSSAVLVDRFEEPDETLDASKRLLRLYCTIVVDRESQKPIVVGKGGAMIKQIGTAAREEMERFFGVRVFLDLHVRVRADWRDDERILGNLDI